jgi:hypothetical protein
MVVYTKCNSFKFSRAVKNLKEISNSLKFKYGESKNIIEILTATLQFLSEAKKFEGSRESL